MSKPNAETSFQVERYDSPLRFMVASASQRGAKYLVQLDSYRNNGECTCDHFRFRCGPALAKGEPRSPALRCKHILQAREFCLNEMLDGISRHREAASAKEERRKTAIAAGYDPDPADL